MYCSIIESLASVSAQVWLTENGAGHVVGVNNIMWETDFPHPTSLWPNTWRFISHSFEDVPADEQELIFSGNAKRVYKIPDTYTYQA